MCRHVQVAIFMDMGTLERRVQVLFDEELYERLQAEAEAERTSVGAYIRDAVADRLDHRRSDARAALQRLWASVDAGPLTGPVDWREEKDLMEREFLRNVP